MKFLFLVTFLVTPTATWAMSCSNILGVIYSSEHFPQSSMWIGRPNSAFTNWAVTQANKTSDLLSSGASTESTLSVVAKERNLFESKALYWSETSPDRSNNIGVLRESGGRAWETELWTPNVYTTEGRAGITNWIFHLFPELSDSWYKKVDRVVTEYVFIDQKFAVESTAFYYSPKEGLIIIHPNSLVSETIMEDVFKRIKLFRKTKNLNHFLIAMQGYFNAMPYQGGSASIGKVFFSALFHSVYKKPIKLHKDIDIVAMALTRSDFIRLIGNTAL